MGTIIMTEQVLHSNTGNLAGLALYTLFQKVLVQLLLPDKKKLLQIY